MHDEITYNCWSCGHEIDTDTKVGRKDECPNCYADLHCCKNCRFWDPGFHNECRENISHFIRDREKANFCMSFELRPSNEDRSAEADDARSRLDALFKNLK